MNPAHFLNFFIDFRHQRPHLPLEEVTNSKLDTKGKDVAQVPADFHIPIEKVGQDQTVIAKLLNHPCLN